MNALRMFMDRDQFRLLLHFSDGASVDVFGRTARDIPPETDERLKALAGGELSSEERNRLLEKLVGSPKLLRRLAQHLQDQVSGEDQ
jgi:hypothetical protein